MFMSLRQNTPIENRGFAPPILRSIIKLYGCI